MTRLRLLCLFILLSCAAWLNGAVNLGDAFFSAGTSADGRDGAPSKDRVIVLANSNDKQSITLARYYCEKRGIPLGNVVSLPLSLQETISREEYTNTLHNPLLQELISRSWVSATPSTEKDAVGRLKPSVVGHKIDFLVLMRGVPLRIQNDTLLLEQDANKPQQAAFQINAASVDSELACMLLGDYPLTAFVRNPLFNKKTPSGDEAQKIIRVARLDGARADHVYSLIDSALEGEKAGLRGRAYFDMGGPHPKGDEWIKQAADAFRKEGFDCTTETGKGLLWFDKRWDAAAVYFGWYANIPVGSITHLNYHFAPGALAWHIHSFSASTLRDVNKSWLAMFAQKGAAASLGNVYEPYLELTHMPAVYFACLSDGKTHGEAAYASLPVLSWMSIMLGDPLYRPAATPLSTQYERMRSWEDRSPYAQYVAIRLMNLLEARGKPDEAILLGRQSFRKAPGLALALELGKRLWDSNAKQAGEYFAHFAQMAAFEGDDIPVAMDALFFLAANNRDTKTALKISRTLVDSPATPPRTVAAVLPKAIVAARTQGEFDLATRWQAKLRELTPPPAPATPKTPKTSAQPAPAAKPAAQPAAN